MAGAFDAALPPGAAGRWCHLAVSVASPDPWWVRLEVADVARDQVVRAAFLGPPRRGGGRWWRATLLHVPGAAEGLTLHVIATAPGDGRAPIARLRVLGRAAAALALLRHGWRLLPDALAGDAMGAPGRARAMLGQAPARAGEAPCYDTWIALHDRWGDGERAALAQACADGPPIAAVVVGEDATACAATLASLAAQWRPPARIAVVARPGDWRPQGEPWVLVLRAGEILADHALACFALAASRDDGALGLYADLDGVTEAGRAGPLFKPGADPWLLRSGHLARGACLFRADVMTAIPDQADSELWRQALAQGCAGAGLRSIPFVLTHVPGALPATPPAAPCRADRTPFVSIVIPTAARSAHMRACLRRVLETTSYSGTIEVLLAVSRVDPGDRRQAATLAWAAGLAHVRVLDLGLEAFNYARVNNLAVRRARGDVVLLLNDDVAPIRPDWLQRMVAYLGGAYGMAADIVGARLLYGNGRVQHGGVIMGLANLCEHAFRLSRRDDFGPYGVAALDRQVSAVTAACMLLTRSCYETLGGMDPAFAIALNDVDLCLRAGERGGRIVFAAGVELHHYESLSLGRHYAGGRAGLEAIEVRRLRDRWADAIAADRFYNPSASLEPGSEFQPAFPPRLTPLGWIEGKR